MSQHHPEYEASLRNSTASDLSFPDLDLDYGELGGGTPWDSQSPQTRRCVWVCGRVIVRKWTTHNFVVFETRPLSNTIHIYIYIYIYLWMDIHPRMPGGRISTTVLRWPVPPASSSVRWPQWCSGPGRLEVTDGSATGGKRRCDQQQAE